MTFVLPSQKSTHIPTTVSLPIAHPQASRRLSVQGAVRQYWILLRILLADYRREWPGLLILGMIMPLGFVFLVHFLRGVSSQSSAVFLMGGNLTLTIVFGPMMFLIAKLGTMHRMHQFDYWVALPVRKTLFLLALISSALVFSLPNLVGSYVLSSLVLGLSLTGWWVLLILVPLGVLPLSCLGILVGMCFCRSETAGSVGDMLCTIISFLSPMLIPVTALPPLLQWFSWVLPTTYIANAFREVLSNSLGWSFLLNLVLMLGFAVMSFWFTHWRLRWRVS